MKSNIVDKIMAEPIRLVGFPQIIVTRAFAYQWLKSLGWSERERGYGSLDHVVFLPAPSSEPLTDPDYRDGLLARYATECRR